MTSYWIKTTFSLKELIDTQGLTLYKDLFRLMTWIELWIDLTYEYFVGLVFLESKFQKGKVKSNIPTFSKIELPRIYNKLQNKEL